MRGVGDEGESPTLLKEKREWKKDNDDDDPFKT